MAENRDWRDEVEQVVSVRGQRAWLGRKGAKKDLYESLSKVEASTWSEVEDGMMSPGITKEELLQKFSDPAGNLSARVMIRHAIQQGFKEISPGRFEPKWRCIDDAARSLSNLCTRMMEIIVTPMFYFPAIVCKEIARQCSLRGVPLPEVSVSCDDIWAAYRRIPNAQENFSIVAVYSFQRKCVLYFAVKGHSFGLVSSVVNFNRLPHLLVEVAVRLFAVPCTHFVDDYCAVDLKIGRGSGQQALVSLHEEVGFDFEDSKRKFATDESDDSNTFLGVITDTSKFKEHGEVSFRPTEKRKSGILRMLREAKKAAFLSGHSAQVILGKLGFCLQAAACKIGRAAAQALVQRAACEDPKVDVRRRPGNTLQMRPGIPVRLKVPPQTTGMQEDKDKQTFDDCALRVLQVGKLGQITIQAEDPIGNKRILWVDPEDLIPVRSTR